MLEISLSTDAAQRKVESLNTSLDAMATKLETVGKKSSMSFGKTAIAVFKSMSKEMDVFSKKATTMRDSALTASDKLKTMASSHKLMGKELRDSKKELGSQLLSVKEYTKGLATVAAQFAAVIKAQQDYSTSMKKQTTTLAENTKTESQRNKLKKKIIADDTTAKTVLDQNTSSVVKLTTALKDAAKVTRDAAKATAGLVREQKSQATILNSTLTPLQTYQARIDKLADALRKGTISQNQYGAAASKAGNQLVVASQKANLAKNGLGGMTSQFHLANQATSGFRAALMGAGLHFGIFTSATIAAASAAYVFARGIAGAIKVGTSFEKVFDRVSVVMGRFGEGLTDNKINAQVDLVKNKIMELGETTQFSSNQVADAAVVLAQAGLDGLQIYNALPGALSLAAVGMVDVAQAADIAVGVMYAFSGGALNMTKTTMGLDHTIDVLAATSVKTNVKLGELAKTLQYVAPIASKAGMSIEETSSAIGILANAGIKGSMAGTILRRVITEIAVANTKTKSGFSSMGIDIQEMTKNGIDMTEVFLAMKKGMEGMSKTEKIARLKQIFGQWAVSGSAGMVTLAESMAKFEVELDSVTGTAQQMRVELYDNLAGSVENLTSVMQNLGIKAFDAFGPALTSKVREFTSLLKENGPAISKSLASIVMLLIDGASWLVQWGGAVAKALLAFTGFMIVKSTVAALSGSLGSLATQMVGLTVKAQANAIAAQAVNVAWVSAGVGMKGAALSATGLAATFAAFVAGAAGVVSWLAKAASVLLRFAGWVGIIASIALPLMASSLYDVEAAVEASYPALDEYNDILATSGSLSLVSANNLKSLAVRLADDVTSSAKTATAALEELNKAKKDAAPTAPTTYQTARFGTVSQGPSVAELKALEEATLAYSKAVGDLAANIKAKYETDIANSANSLVEASRRDVITRQLKTEEETIVEVIASLEAYKVKMKEGGMATATFLSNSLEYFKTLAMIAFLAGKLDLIAVDREQADGQRRSQEETTKTTSVIKKLIEEYERATGSAAGFGREMTELNSSLAAISAGTPGASAALKEMGYSTGEAKDALEGLKDTKAIEFLSQQLGAVDSRYKDLAKSSTELTTGTLGYAGVVRMAADLVSKMEIPLAKKQQLLQGLIPILKGVSDGTSEANKQFAEFVRKTNEDFATFLASAKLDEIAVQFRNAADASSETGKQAMAQARVMKLLGGSIEDTMTETERAIEFEKAMALAFKNTGAEMTVVAGLRAQFYRSTPTGRLEEEIANLKMQTALTYEGNDALELYNKTYQDHGGFVEKASEAYLVAAKYSIEMRKELERAQAVMGAFEEFGDGIAKLFTDMFTGGIKSFKDFASRLKDMFKRLLSELIYLAIKNQIVVNITGQVSGTGGQSAGGNLMNSLFNSLTGSGQQGQSGGPLSQILGGQAGTAGTAGTAGQPGGGGWNAVLSGIRRLTGFGAPPGGGASANGFNGTGMLTAMTRGWTSGSAAASGGVPWAVPSYGATPSWAGSVTPGTGPVASGSTAAGAGFNYVAAAAGVAAGYNAFQTRGNGGGSSVAAGLTYGVGTYLAAGAVTAGATVVAAGGTLAAGGAAAMGALASNPIGWAIMAVMAIDFLSGGKVFGTRFAPESSSEQVNISSGGGSATNSVTEVRQRALFGGRQRRTTSSAGTAEQEASANQIFGALREATQAAATALGVAMPEIIGGAFTIKKDKKGKIVREFSEVLGKTYDEGFEEFQKRLQGENIVALVKAAYGNAEEIEGIAEKYRNSAEDLSAVALAMLGAQADIKMGMGLLRGTGDNQMTNTIALLEEVALAGESLADTYSRVSQSVFAVEAGLTVFGVQMGKTRDEFVIFSGALVESLGGLEKAKEKLDLFKQAFLEFAAFNEFEGASARDTRGSALEEIGLSANTTAEQFMTAFLEALPTLTADELADWIDAGYAIGKVKLALDQMREAADEGANTLVKQVAAQINAIAALGASEAELVEARMLGMRIIRRALDDFMSGIDDQLAQFEGRSVSRQINQITKAMNDNIRTARSLGASENMLNRIRRLAGYQISQVVAELQASIANLAGQLYGQAESGAAALNTQLDASSALFDAEMARYEAAQDAIKRIDEYLRGLAAGELAPGSWQDRLGASETNFMDMLRRAQGGDTEALGNITDYADQYLNLARDFFGSTTEYASIYDFVTGALRGLSNTLGEIAPPVGGPTGGGSDGPATTALSAADRFRLALQLAQQIGDLGLALDTSVFDLLESFGVDVRALATDLGITFGTINEDVVANLQLMSSALGISTADLVRQLGIGFEGLAEYYGVANEELMAGNFTALQVFAEAMGVNIFEAVELLGLDLVTLGQSFGFDLDELTTANFQSLVVFATSLGTSILDLGLAIGADVKWLGESLVESITNSLALIPDLPTNISDAIAPFLQAIREADTSAELNTAMAALLLWVSALPADQAALLTPLLTALGFDVVGSGDRVAELLEDSLVLSRAIRDSVVNSGLNVNSEVARSNQLLDGLYDRSGESNGFLRSIRDGINELVTAGGEPPPPPGEGSLVPASNLPPPTAQLMTSITGSGTPEEHVVQKLEAVEVAINNVARVAGEGLTEVMTEQQKLKEEMSKMRSDKRRKQIGEGE